MIGRFPQAWQTTMADLALILFMVTAAGLDGQEQQERNETPATAAPAARGEALAVYRAEANALPLRQWLAEQAPDRRQYLTIIARFSAGRADEAARGALDLAAQAGSAGAAARIVLEPGTENALFATLAFDRPVSEPVAQSLQKSRKN